MYGKTQGFAARWG